MRGAALCIVSACGFAPSASIDAASSPDAADATTIDALPADLVAWYPMDDLSMIDATGHGHDGACAACPTQAAGVFGNGLAFSNARIDVPGTPELETPEGTVAGWLELDAISNGYVCPFGKIFNPVANGNTWQLCLFQASFWQVFLTTSTAMPSFTAGAQIIPGQWQHVAITWTSSKVELFVGGASLGSVSSTQLVFDGNIMTIGADRNFPDTIDSPISGAVDELKLFDRALSPAEIVALGIR